MPRTKAPLQVRIDELTAELEARRQAAMLRAGHVDEAFSSMQDLIHTTLTEAAEQDMYYARALGCLSNHS